MPAGASFWVDLVAKHTKPTPPHRMSVFLICGCHPARLRCLILLPVSMWICCYKGADLKVCSRCGLRLTVPRQSSVTSCKESVDGLKGQLQEQEIPMGMDQLVMFDIHNMQGW